MLAHFCGGKIKTFDDLLADLADRPNQSGLGQRRLSAAVARRRGGRSSSAALELLIVQDMFASPLWRAATYQLPGAAFAERAGSYVNFADRLQSFTWAIRPPAGVRVEGQLYWELLGHARLVQCRAQC